MAPIQTRQVCLLFVRMLASEERVRQCGATLAVEITVRVATCALALLLVVLIVIGMVLSRT